VAELWASWGGIAEKKEEAQAKIAKKNSSFAPLAFLAIFA
jgi:hypothetical protein